MSNQSSCQTVSQDSYLITLLVNTWSATLHIVACHRVSQDSYLILSNHSAGQRVISQFVKQSVKTVTCYLITQLVNKWSASLSNSQDSYLITQPAASNQPVCHTVTQDSYPMTLSWSTSDELACQTVSQDSYMYVITQLVNKWSASYYSQSRQLSNNSAGQQVISQFVK